MSSKLPHGMCNDLCLCGTSVSCVCLAVDRSGLDRRIPLWVERDGCHWRPVPGLTAPASRMALPRLLVESVPAGEQRMILPGMAFCRRDVADGAVPMLMVVPVPEVCGPLPGGREIGKALGREGGAILGGAEQRLDEGIVVH